MFGGFPPFAYWNNAVMITCVQVFRWTYISWHPMYLRVELLVHMATASLFEELPDCFPSGCTTFFPASSIDDIQSFRVLTSTYYLDFYHTLMILNGPPAQFDLCLPSG